MNELPFPEREDLPEQSLSTIVRETPPEDLHNFGWIRFNREEHEQALAARHYAQRHFPPELQQAFLDGVVFLHYVETTQQRQQELSESIDRLLHEN